MSDTITTEEAKLLRDAATEGKWKVTHDGCLFDVSVDSYNGDIAELCEEPDARCIAFAVNNIVPVCEKRDEYKAKFQGLWRAVKACSEGVRNSPTLDNILTEFPMCERCKDAGWLSKYQSRLYPCPDCSSQSTEEALKSE